jgi:hypothetical protein
MKTFPLMGCIAVVRASAAPTVDWSLVKASVAGFSNDVLLIESAVVIHADKEELRVEAWSGESDAVLADVDITASDGSKLARVPSTGPAESFRKIVVIRPGESRRFVVFTGSFSIERSGSYIAKGKLLGVSTVEYAVEMPLRDLRFDVEVVEQRKPNHTLELTLTAGPFFDAQRAFECPSPLWVSVAHL